MLFRPRLLGRRDRRRAAYRRWRRRVLWTLLALFVLDAWSIVRSRGPTIRQELPPEMADGQAGVASVPGGLRLPSPPPSVYIVSVHRNTEPILRAAWAASVLRLVDVLRGAGVDVFVSAIESGSQDHTKEALTALKAALRTRGVDHAIELGTTVWQQLDELNAWPAADSTRATRPPGWIWDPTEDHYALRRIPYLARVRNQAMAPLRRLARRRPRRRLFDRVLWVNDVAFDVADALTLLDTHGGDYAAACAVDFFSYPLYYDTFALRDAHGDKAVSPHWPWFRTADARTAVRAGQPVRVQSCWNGLVAFDATPFYGGGSDTNADSDQNDNGGGGLLFRGIDDSLAEYHLEASECCLVHADNPLSATRGVWLNPNVRVAYSVPVYEQVRRPAGGRFPGAWAAVHGEWTNRWERAKSHVQFALEERAVAARLRKWQSEEDEAVAKPKKAMAAADDDDDDDDDNQTSSRRARPREEPGAVCLINEMQIMWQNGWKHL